MEETGGMASNPNLHKQDPTVESNQEPNNDNRAPANGRSRTKALLGLTALLLILAVIWLLYWLLYEQFYESTDDAYANGNLVTINTAVPGNVVGFYADDTSYVVEGQLLVQLDPTPYKIKLDKELASLAATVLHVKQLYDQVHVDMATVETRKIALSRAEYDYANRAQLVNTKAISNEDYIHSRDALARAQISLKQAEFQLKLSQDALGSTPIYRHPQIEQQKNNVLKAFYDLQHCNIYSPCDGYIAQRTVNVGKHVTEITPLMSVIPINYVWVDANFKETQLTYMRVGQPASLWLDIYGSKVKYEGKVLGIASGTGSVFSLIPPQNATGNWIKIVQRLPVRISINPEQAKKFPIRVGLSATVTVDISNPDLPMLAQVANEKPIAQTNVFQIEFTKIHQHIDRIIRENLKPLNQP